MANLDAAACAKLLAAMTTIGAGAALTIRAAAGRGGVRYKDDGSPVTDADIEAEAAIRSGLAAVAPSIPIVSEEEAEHRPVAAGASYFLVDPLDGTREFVAGRDEFVIAIALMADGAPLLGVVVAPALGTILARCRSWRRRAPDFRRRRNAFAGGCHPHAQAAAARAPNAGEPVAPGRTYPGLSAEPVAAAHRRLRFGAEILPHRRGHG